MFGSKVKSLLSDSAYLQLQTCNKQLNPQSLTLSWVETDEVFTLKPECYVRRTLRYDRCLSAKKRQKSFTQRHINCSLVSLGLCSVCFCIKWHNYCWFFFTSSHWQYDYRTQILKTLAWINTGGHSGDACLCGFKAPPYMDMFRVPYPSTVIHVRKEFGREG